MLSLRGPSPTPSLSTGSVLCITMPPLPRVPVAFYQGEAVARNQQVSWSLLSGLLCQAWWWLPALAIHRFQTACCWLPNKSCPVTMVTVPLLNPPKSTRPAAPSASHFISDQCRFSLVQDEVLNSSQNPPVLHRAALAFWLIWGTIHPCPPLWQVSVLMLNSILSIGGFWCSWHVHKRYFEVILAFKISVPFIRQYWKTKAFLKILFNFNVFNL